MSTKTNTSTTNTYNQAGMNAYNSMIPGMSSTINSLMNSPLNNSMFSNQLAQAQGSASQVNQRNIGNTMNNLKTGGGLIGQAGGYSTAALNTAMLSGSTNSSNAFNSTLNSALSNRNYALGAAENFSPLQTGANTTQTKSGLGTWLPQVAGAALGGLTGGLGAGLGSSLFGGGAGSLGSTGASALSATPTSYNFGANPLAGYGMPSGII
jgi:hypothetical protein